jgi:hypothetical protein
MKTQDRLGRGSKIHRNMSPPADVTGCLSPSLVPRRPMRMRADATATLDVRSVIHSAHACLRSMRGANPDQARFCMACTAPLGADASVSGRRIVTIIFSDLVGSTALGESLDPEALRAGPLLRCHARMHRAARRTRREVHRGRDHGRVRSPPRP